MAWQPFWDKPNRALVFDGIAGCERAVFEPYDSFVTASVRHFAQNLIQFANDKFSFILKTSTALACNSGSRHSFIGPCVFSGP
jgi:hypothetical protein